MASIQLFFSLRVSSGVKTVHLLGSWDRYAGQLPLSKDRSSSKSGTWKGTFRFHSATLEPGRRYWYYYIVDDYHVTHNPSVSATVEPTTGRALNVLDVPASKDSYSSAHKSTTSASSSSRKSSSRKSSSSSHTSSKTSSSSRHRPPAQDQPRSSAGRASLSLQIPQGRPLSFSQIKCPKPVSPHATRQILQSDYYNDALAALSARFRRAALEDDDHASSPTSSSASPRSYRSSSGFSSSGSGYSTPDSNCSARSCERYGITRKGQRVKLDCGGARCGYDSSSSSCCSAGSDYQRAATRYRRDSTRRHGIVMT